MDPPPPPYEAVGTVTLSSTPTLPPVQLEGCIHRHDLLVVIHQDANQLRPIGLHYWNSRRAAIGSERMLMVPSNMEIGSLQLINGFRDLGAVEVRAKDAAGWVTIHNYISSIVSNLDTPDTTMQSDQDLISTIVSRLRSQDVSEPSATIHLASVPVFGNSADRFAEGGPALAWKWVKPDVEHPKRAGFWEFEFETAIRSRGTENAGVFSLLVRGVPQDTKAKTELAGKRVMVGSFD